MGFWDAIDYSTVDASRCDYIDQFTVICFNYLSTWL